jgi:hypothetical protein
MVPTPGRRARGPRGLANDGPCACETPKQTLLTSERSALQPRRLRPSSADLVPQRSAPGRRVMPIPDVGTIEPTNSSQILKHACQAVQRQRRVREGTGRFPPPKHCLQLDRRYRPVGPERPSVRPGTSCDRHGPTRHATPHEGLVPAAPHSGSRRGKRATPGRHLDRSSSCRSGHHLRPVVRSPIAALRPMKILRSPSGVHSRVSGAPNYGASARWA